MKIYFIGQKGMPALFGGIERHVEELAIKLANLGHEVFVYTRPSYTSSKLSSYKGVHLISLKSIPTKRLDAITHTLHCCWDIATKRDPDIIHFHSIGPSSLIWLMRLIKPKVPIVSTFHTRCYLHKKWGIFARSYLKLGEMMACRLPDETITVSKSLTSYAGEKYGIHPVYIPNGVAVNRKIKPQLIKDWALEENGYILAVSRLVGHKGLHFLIEAYKNINTDKKLVITGSGVYTDKYVKKLKGLAKDNPKIIFTGNQCGEILRELYSNAYLFVQPSESEGLSLALLEAMSFEKVVLASNIPENIEAAGNSGFFFESKDVLDLEEKMKFILAHPEITPEIGKLNRERVMELYNWENIAKNTVQVYEKAAALIQEKNNSRKFKLIKRFINLF